MSNWVPSQKILGKRSVASPIYLEDVKEICVHKLIRLGVCCKCGKELTEQDRKDML